MKRIILSLLLIFTISFETSLAQSSSVSAKTESKSKTKAKKWDKFFGVEGGVGMMDVVPFLPFLPLGINLGLFKNDYGLRGLSYGGGIFGGWQRYTHEKVGIRHTLGLRVFGALETKTGNIEGSIVSDTIFANETKNPVIDVTTYYALDGFFDFVKSEEAHFGMSLGFSINFLQITEAKNLFGIGIFFQFAPRLGLYVQFDDNVVELLASIPFGGIAGGDFAFNSTLTLGYKYLF